MDHLDFFNLCKFIGSPIEYLDLTEGAFLRTYSYLRDNYYFVTQITNI